MTNLILIISILLGIVAFVVSIQTISETRNKYYNDYIKRKNNEKS